MASGAPSSSSKRPPCHKAIVRRLLPELEEEQFWGVVDGLNIRDGVSWSYFVGGSSGSGFSKGQPTVNPDFRYGRAYLNFHTADKLEYFLANFAGYPFLDAKGNEWPCSVMRAPLARVPQEGKRRKDVKHMGTIEEDPDYAEFLAELEKEPEPAPTTEQLIAAREAEEKAKEEIVTPLVAFMRKKRDEKERRKKARPLAPPAPARPPQSQHACC